jgi:hypothetical protein
MIESKSTLSCRFDAIRPALFAVAVTLSWPLELAAQGRFDLDELRSEGIPLWELVLLLAGGYAIGLGLMFPALLVKYRKHAGEAGYVLRCWRVAAEQSPGFAGIAAVALLLGAPLVLIPTGILMAVVNLLFFQSDELVDIWLIASIVLLFVGAGAVALVTQVRETAEKLPTLATDRSRNG